MYKPHLFIGGADGTGTGTGTVLVPGTSARVVVIDFARAAVGLSRLMAGLFGRVRQCSN
jgi:hypothetical protein